MLRTKFLCASLLICSSPPGRPVSPDVAMIEKYDDVIRALGGLYGIDTRGAWVHQQVQVCSAFRSFSFAKYEAKRSSSTTAFLVIYSPETKRVPNKPWLDGIVLIPYSSDRLGQQPTAERDATIATFNHLWLREVDDKTAGRTDGMTSGDVGRCFARFSGLDVPQKPGEPGRGALDITNPPTNMLINLVSPKGSTLYIQFGARGTVLTSKVGGPA